MISTHELATFLFLLARGSLIDACSSDQPAELTYTHDGAQNSRFRKSLLFKLAMASSVELGWLLATN